MRLIWATRGRTWGFRFILDGGMTDPLPAYDEVFSGADEKPEYWCRMDQTVALRFSDPMTRKDAAGRIIPHEFVVFGPLAESVGSVEDGLEVVWPLVASEFARIWELPKPPTPHA